MTLGERIKEQRMKYQLSQESLAALVGVSRQAVAKWEGDQSSPSSDNLIALARIFDLSLDQLVLDRKQPKGPNPILRSNLTLIAIAFQAGALNACTNIWYNIRTEHMEPDLGYWLCGLLPLLLCSMWMASNHRFEPDLIRRRRNTRIELIYCLVQLGVALLTMRFGLGLVGGLLTLVVLLVYVLVVNPKHMDRKFTK